MEAESVCDFDQELSQWRARMLKYCLSQQRLSDVHVGLGQNFKDALYIKSYM